MDAMEGEHGYDALFVSQIPGYLRCVVCRLVLRDPLQVLKCGHKFCAPCFERLKGYSKNMNTVLCCPVDRDIIDLTKVCEDYGMNRVVGDLTVKCANSETGCSWQGDLRDLKVHEVRCEHGVLKQSSIHERNYEILTMLKQLNKRVGRCEETLTDKEKDIAFLKYNLQEMKTNFNEKLNEVELLKEKNINLENELEEMNNKQQGFNLVFEVKVEQLSLKNVILEEKIQSLENQFLLIKTQSEGNQMDITTVQGEVQNIKCLKIGKGLETSKEISLKMNLADEHTGKKLEKSKEAKKKILIKQKEKAKKIEIVHRIGDPKNVTISVDHNIEFKTFSTIAAPSAVVPKGKKVWYEVMFNEVVDDGSSQIGWATSKFRTSDVYIDHGVGDCLHSYGFHGQQVCIWHSGKVRFWGKKFDPKRNRVLGVAADMENGQLLFGIDGDWSEPMGVAFDGIDKDIGLFPAISAQFMKLFVNFGESDFLCGPPDSTFDKLYDVL